MLKNVPISLSGPVIIKLACHFKQHWVPAIFFTQQTIDAL